MDSPRPVPPLVRARAGSARQKRLKTIADSPGPSPTPWSRTAIAAEWSSPATSRRMSRPSAWSMALVTRLRTIRSTRRGSASAEAGVPGLLDEHLRVALVGQRAGHVDDPAGHVDEVDVLGLEHGGAGVEAADLEQVGEQRLEPVELESGAARPPAR